LLTRKFLDLLTGLTSEIIPKKRAATRAFTILIYQSTNGAEEIPERDERVREKEEGGRLKYY